MDATEWLIERLAAIEPQPYIPSEWAMLIRMLENFRIVADLETQLDTLTRQLPHESAPRIRIPDLRPSKQKAATRGNRLSQALNIYL